MCFFFLNETSQETVLGTVPRVDESLWQSARCRHAGWFSENLKAVGYTGAWSGNFHFHYKKLIPCSTDPK